MQESRGISFTMALVDIAQALAHARCAGDPGRRYALFEEWARDFLFDFEARAVAGRRPVDSYAEDLRTFAVRQAASYGFQNGSHAREAMPSDATG